MSATGFDTPERRWPRDTVRRFTESEVLPHLDFTVSRKLEKVGWAWVVDTAVRLHGGMGCLRESEVERQYRDMWVLGIGCGTNEIMTGLTAKTLGYK